MNRNKRNILKGLLLGLWAWAGAACTDPAEEQGYYGGLRPGEVALQWVGPNMGVQHVKARGNDTKTAAEQDIYNVHVFIFNQSGEYLAADGSDAFQGYQYINSGRNWVLQSDMFENKQEAQDAIVVAVANVPPNAFGDLDGQGRPNDIQRLDDFKDFVWNLPTFTVTLPSDGLPMIGRAEADLSPDAAEKITLVQMQSLMARIDLNFTMDPYQSSDDGQNPSLRIDEVRVGNFPHGATVEPQLDPTIVEPADQNWTIPATTKRNDIVLEGDKDAGIAVAADDFTGHILREGEPQSLTLYMFEHARAAKALEEVILGDGAKPFPEGKYPENITEEEKQRYKNYLADDEAAYIELEGVYTNHNDYKYAVTYRLYPGKNAVDDFTIRHNRQYIHNITVTGITVNNMGEEALLDTRVDIDNEENPYFIEMLREREHDAHFNVTPMDVFIYKGGTVKVEIVDPDKHKWIRMEPIKRAATEAGDGKRDYFTINLLDELVNSTEYTVESSSVTKTHEERIYFYIDENVPTPEQAERGEEVEAREATLRITYTKPTGSTGIQKHTRDIIIRQAGMLPVYFNKFNNDYEYPSRNYYFYLEEYEEYLAHYDGKNSYNETYSGLEWGFDGVLTGLGPQWRWQEYLDYGWRNTMEIMKKFRETNPYEKADITLNDRPRGAAEYCYNKNKRNENGQVVEVHWYLPTISEMEYALDKYYGDYEGVFKENYYWSSNPGNGDKDGRDLPPRVNAGANTGENTHFARATNSQYRSLSNTFEHARSETDYPYNARYPEYISEYPNGYPRTGGFAKRTEVFRIHAMYVRESPDTQEAPLNNLNNY